VKRLSTAKKRILARLCNGWHFRKGSEGGLYITNGAVRETVGLASLDSMFVNGLVDDNLKPTGKAKAMIGAAPR